MSNHEKIFGMIFDKCKELSLDLFYHKNAVSLCWYSSIKPLMTLPRCSISSNKKNWSSRSKRTRKASILTLWDQSCPTLIFWDEIHEGITGIPISNGHNFVTNLLSFHVPLRATCPSMYTAPFPLAKSFLKVPLNRCPFVMKIVPGPSLFPFEKDPSNFVHIFRILYKSP